MGPKTPDIISSYERPVVLVVDDSPDSLTAISELLKRHYQVKVAQHGERALTLIDKCIPDLILLDIVMPVMNGYETCQRIKANKEWRDIPVIFLTSKNDIEAESRCFELGAEDFISKPVNPISLFSRVKTHLMLKQAKDSLKNQNQFLESEINRRIGEVTTIQEVSIMALASLAETRDRETGFHIQRTKLFVKAVCDYLLEHSLYEDQLNSEIADLLIASSPLHDIGKVGIPDSILLKPGKLTSEEFEVIKTHTTLGRDALAKTEHMLKHEESFFRYPKEIVCYHHERWDGLGYPEGLKAEDIPLSARIVALADVYDALTSKRVYKPAYSHTFAMENIANESGRHFDPVLAEVFRSISDTFQEIKEQYKDEAD